MPDALAIIHMPDLIQIRLYCRGQKCWTWFYWLDVQHTIDA
jgi:hypothetical protein